MRAMGRAETHASRAKARGLPRARLTFAAFPFMLPVLVDEVPEGPDWVFELKLDGVRGLGLRDRKARLRELVPAIDPLRYTDHFEGDGEGFFRAACEAGLEGVIAKRADGPYRGGRHPEWRKIKCQRRQEFVIGGYTDPKGTRAHLGAVHLGVYADDALVYVGRAGSGLDSAGLRDLHRRLRGREVPTCPFTRGEPPRGREHHWARPELVCEVRFSEW